MNIVSIKASYMRGLLVAVSASIFSSTTVLAENTDDLSIAPWLLPTHAAPSIPSVRSTPSAWIKAKKTRYPIVLAHGFGGFTSLGPIDGWNNALTPCFFSFSDCNPAVALGQKSFTPQVDPFQSSEVRGLQLYNQIKNYMASSGENYVNIVAHSMGGLDMRKAARLLKDERGGYPVKYGISIASPHRGTPLAKYFLNQSILSDPLQLFGSIYGVVLGQTTPQDFDSALKQLMYDDWPNDGLATGTKRFNTIYPPHYMEFPRSIVTGQDGPGANIILQLAGLIIPMDADGCASTDANGDGALGQGDGVAIDDDDDGVVGMNSQQMGYRLRLHKPWFSIDIVEEYAPTGYVQDLNSPNCTQMTSHNAVVKEDHIGAVSNQKIYSGIAQYIATGNR